MGHFSFLHDLAITFAVGVLAAVLLARLRFPTVAGLLVAGAVVGPFALGLVTHVTHIEVLAELGVVFLLFSIGLEFSLSRLRHIAKHVLVGGSIQVGLTGGAAAGIAYVAGEPLARAIFWGFVFAMSSTAIVLRALSERGEIDAPHGRFIVGALLFQDLCIVPMMLLVPVLAGRGGDSPLLEAGIAMGKAAAVVVGTLLAARLIVPRLLASVDATRSREIFLLAVLCICIGTAWLTSLVGLSLALGAFIAGLMIADTDYRHRAMSEVLPLRDSLTAIFFISLGMLFNGRVVLERPLLVLLLLAAFVVGKALVAALSALAMRFPARAVWLAAVGLAQFGEFGFVLTKVAQKDGLISAGDSEALLAAGVLSMFLTRILIHVAPHVTAGERVLRPLARLLGARSIDDLPPEEQHTLKNHVVIVGYGFAGRTLAASLAAQQVPYVVLELNAETVRSAQQAGEPVFYGDVTSREALEHAGVPAAQAVVLLINDPHAARRAVDGVRDLAPETPVLTRTRYVAEGRENFDLGAADVVCEELESGVEIVARVLRQLRTPRNVIDARVEQIRAATQRSPRKLSLPRHGLGAVAELADLRIESFLVGEEDHARGRSPAELQLRQRTEASIVAVRRGERVEPLADPSLRFEAGDLLFLVGPKGGVDRALALLRAG